MEARNASGSARLGFRVQNKAEAREADVDLFDIIGDPYEGTTAKDFVQELRSLDVDHINLTINSPGGYVDDALAMYAALQSHPATVTATITGTAASAASFVAMAADKILIAKHASMMIHEASTIAIGPATLFRAVADELDAQSENIASIYSERAGGTVDEWRHRMKAGGGKFGTTYRGQEAVDAGLADEVATVPARNAQPMRAVAQVTNEDPPPPLDLSGLPPLADHAGYKAPIPNLAGLLQKHPIKIAAPRGNGG